MLEVKVKRTLVLVWVLLLAWAANAEEIGVGVLGNFRNPDATEKKLHLYLGQMKGIDLVIKPDTADDLFKQLATITKDGKKIRYLVLAGHGLAGKPRIKLGAGYLFNSHVDLDAITKKLEATKELNSLENQLFEAPPEARAAIQKKIDELLATRKALRKQLDLLDAVSNIMTNEAEILLLNCSAASCEKGLIMCRNLGQVLLGSGGGTVVASTVDIDIATMQNSLQSLRSLIWDTPGRWTSLGHTWVRGKWKRIDIPQGRHPYLFAAFHPSALRLVKPGQDVTLEPTVDAHVDSERLRYYWNDEVGGSENSKLRIPSRLISSHRTDVKVKVTDVRGRVATDTVTIRLFGVEIRGPVEVTKNEPASLSASFRPAHMDKGLSYRWRDTTTGRDLGEGRTREFKSDTLGSHTISVEAFSSQGASLGTDIHSLEVIEGKATVEPTADSDPTEFGVTGASRVTYSDLLPLKAELPDDLKARTARIVWFIGAPGQGQELVFVHGLAGVEGPLAVPGGSRQEQAQGASIVVQPTANDVYYAEARDGRNKLLKRSQGHRVAVEKANFQVALAPDWTRDTPDSPFSVSRRVTLDFDEDQPEGKIFGHSGGATVTLRWLGSSEGPRRSEIKRHVKTAGGFVGNGHYFLKGYTCYKATVDIRSFDWSRGQVESSVIEKWRKAVAKHREQAESEADNLIASVVVGAVESVSTTSSAPTSAPTPPPTDVPRTPDTESVEHLIKAGEYENAQTALKSQPQTPAVKKRLAQVNDWVSRHATIKQLSTQVEKLTAQKKLPSALALIQKISQLRNQMPGLPAGQTAESEHAEQVYYAKKKEYDQDWRAYSYRSGDYFRAMDWEAMRALCQHTLTWELFGDGEQRVRSSLQRAEQGLAEQQAAWNDYLAARKSFEAGQLEQGELKRKALLKLELAQAKFFAQDPRWGSLTELVNQIKKGRPGPHLQSARQQIESEDYSAAEQSANRALTIDPKVSEAHYLRGRALHGLGKFSEAVQAYDKRLAAQPDDAQALYRKGLTLDRLKRPAESREVLTRALDLNPNLHKARFYRALVHGSEGDFQKALTDIERYLQSEPGDAHAWGVKGSAQIGLGQNQAGENSLAKALQLAPGNRHLLLTRAKLRKSIGNLQGAQSDLEQGLALYPGDQAMTSLLDQVRSRLGPLTVKVNPPTHQLSPGGQMQTVAHASGGKPPYRYEWYVAQERTGTINQVKIWKFNQEGRFDLRVVATDATGRTGEGHCELQVGRVQPQPSSPPPPRTSGYLVPPGKTSMGSRYTKACRGNPFAGGFWSSSRGGSDWLLNNLDSYHKVHEIRIKRFSSDVTTKELVIRVKAHTERGWVTLDELRETNINRTKLTGGGSGRSVGPRLVKVSPARKINAVRLEISGYGWFDAEDIQIWASGAPSRPAVDVRAAAPVNFVGSFSFQDPTRSSNLYRGQLELYKDGRGKALELFKGKRGKLVHPETADAQGYLPIHWSYDPKTQTFILDWTLGGRLTKVGRFSGRVIGNTDNFVLSGRWSSGKPGKLTLRRR